MLYCRPGPPNFSATEPPTGPETLPENYTGTFLLKIQFFLHSLIGRVCCLFPPPPPNPIIIRNYAGKLDSCIRSAFIFLLPFLLSFVFFLLCSSTIPHSKAVLKSSFQLTLYGHSGGAYAGIELDPTVPCQTVFTSRPPESSVESPYATPARLHSKIV